MVESNCIVKSPCLLSSSDNIYFAIVQFTTLEDLSSCTFFSWQSSELSVFETNIRFVGGLLAAYALTGDQVMILVIAASYVVSLSLFE